MKRKHFTEEEKMKILEKQDGSKSVREICEEAGISEATFYHWKTLASTRPKTLVDGGRISKLEEENSTLKRAYMDLLLDSGRITRPRGPRTSG